jgi:hypothetical protein
LKYIALIFFLIGVLEGFEPTVSVPQGFQATIAICVLCGVWAVGSYFEHKLTVVGN